MYLYILRCVDGSHYVERTESLERMLLAHNSGRVEATRSLLPVELKYWERCRNGDIADNRLQTIKGMSRLAREEMIDEFWSGPSSVSE